MVAWLAQRMDKLGPERTRALTHVTQDLSAAFSKVVKQRAPQAVLSSWFASSQAR